MSLERTIRQMMSEAVDPTDTGGAEEASMAMRQLKAIRHFADGIEMRVSQQGDMEEWYQNKLTKAHDYLKTLYSYGKGDPVKEEVDMDKLHDAIKKKLSDEGGAAGFAPLKDVAKKMGVDLTPEMLKGMDDIEQHRDGDYILDVDDDDEEEMNEMKVRGKEVYDKTFANRTQADNYAKKHGGRVQQVGRVFYVFKEELEEAVKYPHMMYDPKTGKGVEAKSPEDHEKYAKMGYTHDKPEDMDEAKRDPSKSGGTGYDLYHKDFSSAMKHAYDYAKKKLGVDIDPQEIDDKVASGPRKPSKGKTNTYRLKGKDGKKAVQIQVHGMDSGKYELNMYKEEVELEEAYKTPAEAGAYEAGKKAARAGKKYDDNPNKKGSKEYTAWSKGHNEARSKMLKMGEEVELTESPMVSLTIPNVTSDMASKLERHAKENDVEYSRQGRTVVLKGKRIDMTNIRTKMGLAQTNLKMVPVKEEVELDEAFTTAIKFPNYFKMDEKERNKIIDIYKKYRGKISSQVGKDGSVTVDGDPTSMRKAEAELKKAGVKFMATESVEIAEAKPPFDVSKADYAGAAKELTQYAKTKGGMDKDDFLSFANRMREIAKKKSPSVMSKFVRDLQSLDTSPREKIVDVMRNNGIKVTMTNRGFQVEDYTDHSVGMSIMEKAIAKIREAEGEKMTDAELKKRDEIMKELEKKKDEFVDRYGDRAKEVMARTAIKMAKGD